MCDVCASEPSREARIGDRLVIGQINQFAKGLWDPVAKIAVCPERQTKVVVTGALVAAAAASMRDDLDRLGLRLPATAVFGFAKKGKRPQHDALLFQDHESPILIEDLPPELCVEVVGVPSAPIPAPRGAVSASRDAHQLEPA